MMAKIDHARATPTAAAPNQWAPRFALGWASLVYAVVLLSLAYPALVGGFLVNPHSDQYIAGFAFRDYAAQYMRTHGGFPLWNPYLYGGMPYVAAMHGDIFYPTFLLRLVLPTDVAMTWSFILHVFLAGVFTYVFLRACGLGFFGALVGGLAYAIGGNVGGLVSPGHDGKLYISALFPLTLLLVLRGVHDGRRWAWGALSIVVGLAVLSPHPQLLQYLLLASGAFALYVAFAEFGGVKLERRVAIRRLGVAAAAIVLGGAIGAIQYLPVREYVPFSPRAGGKGWEHAVSYSLPPEELLNTYLPQFTGMLDKYWGRNGIHFHSEYIGAVVLVLAGLGFGWTATRGGRRFIWFWLGTLVISLLWAMGGYTPFYYLVYAIVPGTKFFRAPSTMLYIVSFSVAVLAACGMDRVVTGEVRRRYLLAWLGAGLLVAILGASGGLTNLAAGVAAPERADAVLDNARDLAIGAIRSFAFVAIAVGIIWAISARRLAPTMGAWLLVAGAAIDLWSIERSYWMFSAPASKLYAADETIRYIKQQSQPARVIPLPLTAAIAAGDPFLRPGGQANGLMVHDVRNVLGYHGNQLGRYNDLLGLEEGGRQLVSRNFWALTNSRFWLTNVDSLPIPGARRVVGPVKNAAGTTVYLFELPGENPLAWLTPVIAKAGDAQILSTVLDPRFDVRRAALFDSAAPVTGRNVTALPEALPNKVTATRYEPGRMTLAIDTPAPEGSALIVSENYYPGWKATVNGRTAPVGRADYTLIGVELPAGAQKVELTFDSAPYKTGKTVTLIALAMSVLWWLGGALSERRSSV
jgi:membrane protein YfhO